MSGLRGFELPEDDSSTNHQLPEKGPTTIATFTLRAVENFFLPRAAGVADGTVAEMYVISVFLRAFTRVSG
jgi:hypothetical protein